MKELKSYAQFVLLSTLEPLNNKLLKCKENKFILDLERVGGSFIEGFERLRVLFPEPVGCLHYLSECKGSRLAPGLRNHCCKHFRYLYTLVSYFYDCVLSFLLTLVLHQLRGSSVGRARDS